jgi:thioredoxin 1
MKIVKYVQENCTPCKMLNQTLERLGLEVDETIMLNDEESIEKAKKELNVMSTPTMILFDDNGNELDRVVGMINVPKIIEFMKKAGKLS